MTDICIIAKVSENAVPDSVLTIVSVIFIFEFIGFSLTDASYIFSFFFWMDLLGIISLPFDMSYLFGPDLTKEKHVHRDNRASEQMMLARLGRILRLGARAGRLSRALKVARYLQKGKKEGTQSVAVAKVISTQLANTLSTRVAFLTICIVVAMPIFGAFSYPEWDDSMGAWTQMLADDTDAYYTARDSSNQSAVIEQETILQEELDNFVKFYSSYLYGPFQACGGDQVGDDFVCHPNDLVTQLFHQTGFSAPSRKSAIRQVSHGSFMAAFDMSRIEEDESAANIALICFVILAMVGFGMVLNSNITVIALQPLERMLAVVRQRCKQIFAYTREIKEEQESDLDDDDEEEYDEQEQRSEFALLERVVSKLAVIVQLRVKQEPDVKEHMDENDLMVHHWTQGHQVPQVRVKGEASRGKEEDNRDARRDDTTPTPGQGSMVVSSINLDLPSEVLAALGSPAGGFNTLDLSKDLRIQVAAHLIVSAESTSDWIRGHVQEHHLHNFVTSVEAKYPENPFHNFAHGLDVLYSLCRYVRLIEANRFLPVTTQFWMMIAAVAHDIGHLGVNNQYLIEIGHELAMRYNDRSPLENMHCAKLFQVVSEPEANVFAQLDKDLYKDMRKGIIGAILHTDMVKHNEMIKELALLYQMHSEAFDAMEPVAPVTQSQSTVTSVINSLIHCADISNPTKPWAVCQKLADLCLDEFFAQGDLEKAAGIPVQMLNDRDKVNRPTSQIGFIEFVICPMVEGEVRLFPQLDSLAQNLAENVRRWSELWQREVAPAEDALAKVEARVHKMESRCAALARAG